MTRLSPTLAEGRWPGSRDPSDFNQDSRSMEPPPHPSERSRFGRWSVARWIPVASVRFLIFFFIGVGATLAWQSYGNAARRMVANLSPRLGWVAPAVTPDAPGSPGLAAASPDQIAALSRSLAAVRQSVDKLAADVSKLQTAKPEPPARTSAAPVAVPAAGATARRSAATAQSAR